MCAFSMLSWLSSQTSSFQLPQITDLPSNNSPFPKGKEFNYTSVLYSDTLGSNWLNSSKVAWRKGLNKDKHKNLFYHHKPANKAEEG